MKKILFFLVITLSVQNKISAQEFVRNLKVYDAAKMRTIVKDLEGIDVTGGLSRLGPVERTSYKYMLGKLKDLQYEMAADSFHISGFTFDYYSGYTVDSKGAIIYKYKPIEYILLDFHPVSKTCQNWATLVLEREYDLIEISLQTKRGILTSASFYLVQFPKDSIHLKTAFAAATSGRLTLSEDLLISASISKELLDLKYIPSALCRLTKVVKTATATCVNGCANPNTVFPCSNEALVDFEKRYNRIVPAEKGKYDCVSPVALASLYKLGIGKCDLLEKTALMLKCDACGN